MKKKPETIRPQKTQKQGTINSARRQVKTKDDFFKELYENNNPTTLPKIAPPNALEKTKNPNDNTNELKSNPSTKTDSDSNTQFMGISKVNRSKDKTNKQSMASFKVNTKGLAAIKKDSSSNHRAQTIQSPKKMPPEQSIAVASPKHPRPRTPTNTTVSSDLTNKSPKLFIPNFTTLRNSSSSSQHHSLSARPFPSNSSLFSITQFDTLSTISNDKLSLFDDSDFDDPKFLENIISQIDNGTVTGCSIYFTSEGQLEWLPCKVISFIPPNNFRIQFKLTGKVKEVPRISLRFDSEDFTRFEKRREAAKMKRNEIDSQLKQESYLISRAEQLNNPIEPEIVKATMKKLSKREKSNSLLSKMLIEMQEQYNYAFAQIDYINLWENNEQARNEFIKNGLRPIKFASSEIEKVPDVHPLNKVSIVVPMFKYLHEIVTMLNDVENDPFFSYVNKKVKKLSDFFKDFKFHFNTATSNARSIILNQLLSVSSKLVAKISDKEKVKSILLMINIRYKSSLSNLTIKSINHIIDPELTFSIVSEEDPEKVDQTVDAIIDEGGNFIDDIYKTFIDKPPLEIDPNDLTNKNLNLKNPQLDKCYKEAKIKWNKNVHENFDNYHEKIAEINKITVGIPRNLNKKLSEILPDDFESVLNEGKNPSVDITTINYDLIRKELDSSNHCLKVFNLNYEKNRHFQFKLFSFDVSKFFKKIKEMHHDFHESVFKYLSSHSGYQMTRISEMISSLDEKCSKKAEDIEQWYEKSTLLLDVASNFQSLSKMLDQVSYLLTFMSDFFYEPTENGFVKLYQVKYQLFNVIKSLEKYKKQDIDEKSQFAKEHERRKEQLQEELNEFKEEISNFHNLDPTKDAQNVNERLKTKKKEFDELKKKISLYQKRDLAIGFKKTEYPIVDTIQVDLDTFLPIWDIAVSLGTEVPKWLSTQFRELNVNLISDTLINWEKILKQTVVHLGENHQMAPMLHKLIDEVSDQIPHLQIIRAFCNPNLRSRHWSKISNLVKMEINPNETITWHWMLESGVEDYIIGINAISRSADFEYKVEKTLHSIIEDLSSLKLRVNEVDGVVRLEDPTNAIEMLADHQKKIQDVMIPPYINPFLSKIKDYDVLSSNVRKILKSTLDTQQKIDELKPAMDSKDLRVQHEEVCLQFDEQVAKFNDFTGNFKLSLSFHQIVSNQKYVDLTKELSDEFEHLKKDLSDILDEKRKQFPRFYLLSDSQLVHLLSTCQNPSKSNELFNIMYPAISHALFNQNETECIGFVSIYDETLMLNKKVKVNPEKVEKWYSQFDREIVDSMRESTKTLLSKRSTRSEKLILNYPIQIVHVVNNIIFTSNITGCFDSFASSFAQNRGGQIKGQFETVLNSMNENFESLTQAYMKKPCIHLSALILNFINNRETVSQLIENNVDSPQNPIWYSTIKYVSVSDPHFDVFVKIGPSNYQYGFEFGLIRYPLPQTKMNNIMNASLMLSMASKIPTVVCGRIGISTIDTLINFTTLIGKMPLIIPCTNYLDFARINQCLDVAEKVNSFIIFKDLDHLSQETFNNLSIEVLRRKETIPNTMRIFGTYSIVSECPEKLKLAYRPILLNDYDAKDQFKTLLSSCVSDENDYIDQLAMKLGSFVNNIAPAFFSKFNFIHPIKIIRKSIIDTFYEIYKDDQNNNKIEPHKVGAELYKTIYNEFKKWYGGYDEFDQLQNVIDSIFDIKTKSKLEMNKNQSKIDDRLNQFETFVQSHFATILLGKPLSGKTVLLNKALDEMKYKVEFINQHSFEPADLYGNENSGLISSLLPQTDIFVFDGILKNSELETIVAALDMPRYFTFGDNTKFLVTDKNRFIFETDDISNASPALIGNCPIFFIGDDFLSLEDRLSFFLERKIKNDNRLIDPFSQTIVGSRISVNELFTTITDFSHFFIPKMEVEATSPFTKLHCISNYFKYLQCSILNYYVTGNVKEKLKNTAENLIQDMPNLCLFSLFWAFAATCNDDHLNEFDEKLKMLFHSKYNVKIESIVESYFDQKKRKWMKWTDSGSEMFPIESDDKNEDVYQLMTDISPSYLLIPLNLLIPALHITNILISEGYNVLICGSRNSSINNLILSTPNVAANFTPYSFSFPKEGTHKIIRKMIRSILPDSNSSHSFTVRKPLLSLFDFDPNFSASELMRFIIEHGYMLNDVSHVRNVVDGIRFVVSCRETDDFNQRLTHHMFVIRIPKPSDNVITSTLSHAISVLWGIQDKNNVISSSLLKLLHESQYVFHFNIEHILSVLQRVAAVKMNKEDSFLIDAIAHESIAVFYNAFHSKNILTSIQNAVSTISKNCSYKEINVDEICGKSLLTNLHSQSFRQVSSFEDLSSISKIHSKKEVSKMKFITSDDSFVDLKISDEMLEKIPNKIKQFDVLSIARTLSTPRTHLTINESCLSSINSKLVTYACEIIQAELHYKRLNEPLMKCYHDQFVNGGITKKHHVLFVTESTLNSEERILLKQLVKSSDVFDLFERGEKLQLMTDMFSSGQNPFDDDTCESMDGYNTLLTNFLLDCQNYFHLCIVTNDKEVIRHTSIYKPFYGQVKNLPKIIESIKIDATDEIREKISNLHNIEPFTLYPYLLKYQNMKYFLIALKSRIERNSEYLTSKKIIIDQIAEIGDQLNEFMGKTIQEMEDLKTLLTSLSKEIESSSLQVEKMTAIAQSDAEKFEKQTKELNDQENAANTLRKESQKQLSETKSILENASKELKALSSRDLAIIKTMNHPPHGVVLVVSAMCIVLDQPIDRSKGDEVVWNSAKKVLNDASFLNKLIAKALDSLTPSVLEQLNVIISDPNFDPKVIQRASSAAKSICTFIRSVVPYYKALEVYKLRAKEVEESENNLAKLRSQYEKAMEALSSSKKDVIDMQNKQNELKEKKKSIENQIFEQSQKIDSYQKVEELMKPFFNQNKNEQKTLEKSINDIVNHCFLQQVVVDLLGPFNNDERNQIAKILTPKIGRYTYLPYEDDENVNKWESLHYPVSLFMKENTLMLSPSSGTRWVAAVGIRKVPDSFIKQILGKNIICSLSILSPNFEEIFVFAIKRNQGIIIYDFDFSNPQPLIMLCYQAQQEKGPLIYQNETIYIPDNFIVYFNVDRLIPSEVDNPLPPVRFVNLSIDASTTTEMIALRLFKLTNLRQTNEAFQIEREISSIKEQLTNSESALRTLLVDSSTKIFSDKNMQWNFTNLVRKRNELVQLQKKLKQQHLWLFDDYPTLTLLAKNLNEFFVPFKKQSSLIWSVFESEFEKVKQISTDSLCHVAQTQIVGIFAAALPLVERVKTCAEAFGLKLDGSNSYSTKGDDSSRRISLSHSDDRLYLSSMILNSTENGEIEAEDDLNNTSFDDGLNSSFDGIRTSRSNDELTKEFDLLDSKGFDRLVVKLNEVTEGQIRDLQSIPNIVKRTHPQRPVLIHTTSASYQLLAFLYIFKCEILKIDDLINMPNLIQNEAQKGSIVVTVCCSKENLCLLLAAVSMITASGFLSPSFRLVCFVLDLPFSTMTSLSPLFESRCDIISLDSPLSIKTVFQSTIKSLTCEGQFTKKVTVPSNKIAKNSKAVSETEKPPLPNKASPNKFDPFAAKLALFDASIVATYQLSTLSKLPSFYAFRTALQCSSDSTLDNFQEIGEFIIQFVYGADTELSSHIGSLRKIWTKFNAFSSSSPSSPLKSPQKDDSSIHNLVSFPNRFINSQYPVPTSFSDRNIQKSLDTMPVLDDPLVFGFERFAFDFFKDHFFEGQNRQQFSSNSNPTICADSIENLDLILLASNINSTTIKKSIKKLQSGHSQKVGNKKNVDASRVSSMTSLMSMANCLNKASCDFMTFEIKLDLIAGNTSNNLKRREQLVRAPKVLDISLIFQPRLMLDSILSQDFMEIKKFGRVITVKSGKDENKYATSQPLHQRLFFSDLFCKGAQFDTSSCSFRKFEGFSKLPIMEFVVTDMSESLKPVRLIHNGNMLMTIFVRKESNDFDFVIFSYAKKE